MIFLCLFDIFTPPLIKIIFCVLLLSVFIKEPLTVDIFDRFTRDAEIDN